MEMAKLTSKGQITIPIAIRRNLHVKEGDNLLFIERPDGVMMVNPDMLGAREPDGFLPAEKQRSTVSADSPAKTMKKTGSDSYDSAGHTQAEPRGSGDTGVTGFDVSALLDEIRTIGHGGK